jgi:1,4-alpha-glucan branching enzyme
MTLADAPTTEVPLGLTELPSGVFAAAPSPFPGMGAVVNDKGTTFRVWAPFADDVAVAGTFTDPQWGDGRVPLARENPAAGTPGHDYWSVFVLGAKDGDHYKFLLHHGGEEIWKLDPYCRDATGRIRPDGSIGPNESIIDDPAFDWGVDGDGGFRMPPWNELVIYEMHIGTFNNVQGKPGTFDEAIGKLSYLRDLGVNAIEVMPAVDFETETSMGYNPALLFAIDDAYGQQKAVQRFVKAAHAQKIAVIFDVVYNHFGPDGLGDCLWRFDGWSEGPHGGIYLYPDARAATDYGGESRPDFGRGEVRQFLRDNAMMWLHEYRADGLRLDSTTNIRRSRQGDIAEGWQLMQWINHDKNRELPWTITIAEDLEDNEWITKREAEDSRGAGFDTQWDVGFFRTVRDAVVPADDGPRSMSAIRDALYKRYNGDAFRRVIYSESHDEVTERFGVKLGRMPEKIWWGHADSWPARKRSTLAAALVFTAPGIPMLFQGQEFLECGTWTDNPATNPDAMLDWTKATTFGGILNLYRDLIKLRRNWFNNTRGLRGQNVNVFHVNEAAKVIALHRWSDGGPGDDVIVAANFSAQAYPSYNLGFPRGGTWYLRFNSDWSGYCNDFSNVGYTTSATDGQNQGMPCNGNVGLGPYSAIILSQ